MESELRMLQSDTFRLTVREFLVVYLTNTNVFRKEPDIDTANLYNSVERY